MRAALFVPLLLSGCAQILAEADGQRARIDVTSDSFARVVFCVGDFVEKRRAGSCQLLDRSTLGAHDPRPNSGPIRIAAGGVGDPNVTVGAVLSRRTISVFAASVLPALSVAK